MRFLKATLLLFVAVFASCNKNDDETTTTPANAYADQEPIDNAKILDFFDKYHMDVDPVTKDVSFVALPAINPPLPDPSHVTSIKEQYPNETNPVNARKVMVGDISHKAYFISFREGDVSKKPSSVDSVFVCYRGRLLDNTTFENRESLPTWFGSSSQGVTLRSLILGWREIFPYFGASTSIDSNSDGSYTYNGYGAGVMFIPSALGYYNLTQSKIPAYSPLIFSFKLMAMNYVDEDGDRIDSKYEMNYDSATNTYTDRDTDNDGRYDAFDPDDDNDGILTKFEIKNPAGGYFTFDMIPDCNDNTPSITTKKHLIKCN